MLPLVRLVSTSVRMHSLAYRASLGTACVRGFHASAPRLGLVDFPLADIGEGITEVEVLKWHVKEGDEVKAFQILCEVQSDKANVEITSRYSGKITKLHHKVGELANVGKVLVTIDSPNAPASKAAAPTPKPTPTPAPTPAPTPSTQTPTQPTQAATSTPTPHGKVLTTPAVRRIAREHHIDLSLLQGTGRDGRVMKSDILSHISGNTQQQQQQQQQQQPTPQQPQAAFHAPTVQPGARVEVLHGFKKAMFKSMTIAASIPQFLMCDELDVTRLVVLRQRLKAMATKLDPNVQFTYMPLFIKATSMALSRHPILNSSISADQTSIIYHPHHNIGFAVDTPHGLLVPNIKGVENLTLMQIARELGRLQTAARAGKLSLADTTGGTFTISNVGTLAGTYAAPVVFSPEVAIGAVGKIQKLPRFDSQGQVVARDILTISWSADHRVIEGAVIARFSNDFKQFLEDPDCMMLEM